MLVLELYKSDCHEMLQTFHGGAQLQNTQQRWRIGEYSMPYYPTHEFKSFSASDKPKVFRLPIYPGCGRICKTDNEPCKCHNCMRLTEEELRERELPQCGGRYGHGGRS
jgi:hypothetical protein